MRGREEEEGMRRGGDVEWCIERGEELREGEKTRKGIGGGEEKKREGEDERRRGGVEENKKEEKRRGEEKRKGGGEEEKKRKGGIEGRRGEEVKRK